jgi:hypothetical protein
MFRPTQPVIVRRPVGAPLLRGATSPATGGDVVDKLARLGAMAQQGLLTPDEFTAAKARLLSD